MPHNVWTALKVCSVIHLDLINLLEFVILASTVLGVKLFLTLVSIDAPLVISVLVDHMSQSGVLPVFTNLIVVRRDVNCVLNHTIVTTASLQ